MYRILQTPVFNKWYKKLDFKERTVIDARIKRVRDSGELGDVKYLGDKLFEFRWRTGTRVYFTIQNNKIIFLINGGKKDGQSKDIAKAKKLKEAFGI